MIKPFMQNINFKYGVIMQEQIVYLPQITSIHDISGRIELIFMKHPLSCGKPSFSFVDAII